MAALRAKTMHNTTRIKSSHQGLKVSKFTALNPRVNPINAKGIAKIVCANVTRDKYFFILMIIPGNIVLVCP
jgi:hypothetical protein